MGAGIKHFATLLLVAGAAVAQGPSQDAAIAQTLIAEIRQLRQDLQISAATIQRVQIAMYRVQAQTASFESAKQTLEQVRQSCEMVSERRTQTEWQTENARQNPPQPNAPGDRRNAESMATYLKREWETVRAEEQQCQVRQTELEAQFRTEEAKMNEFQDRLERLDRYLAGGNKVTREPTAATRSINGTLDLLETVVFSRYIVQSPV